MHATGMEGSKILIAHRAIFDYVRVKEILVKMSKLARVGLQRSALACGILALAVFSNPSARSVKPTSGPATGAIPPEVLSIMAAYGAETVTLDRGSRDDKQPEDIVWTGKPGENQSANLYGDPSKPGWYVTLLKRAPNGWSTPHSHPNDRFITVLAGTMWIGTGAKYDQNNTVGIKAGGFIHDIANQLHYDGARDDGFTIEIAGMGPAGTNRPDKK